MCGGNKWNHAEILKKTLNTDPTVQVFTKLDLLKYQAKYNGGFKILSATLTGESTSRFSFVAVVFLI